MSFAIIILIFILGGCGGIMNRDTSELPVGTAATASDDIYREAMTAEKIDVREAYDLLKDLDFDDPEKEAFVQQLKDLLQCSGGFVQVSEDTGNRYGAEVSFYLASGVVRCAVDYSGYMGEIIDGDVVETKEAGYRFETSTKGDLFGNDQDFKIYFGNDQLHITWAENCDYVLTRGDGSVESVQDYTPPFDETAAYESILEVIDNYFSDFEHKVEYDKNGLALNIYVQGMDGLRNVLAKQDKDVTDAWQGVSESMCTLSDQLLTITKVGGDAYYVNIYWVDKLRDNGYIQDDMLLWVQNGVEKYNVAKKSTGYTGQTTAGNNQEPQTTDTTPSEIHSASMGERNALEMAREYLDAMAFSRDGLVEQLEYEGFSHSEAVYGADHCGADWYEQAEKMAAEYLDAMPFSRSELIEQLEYEGFSHDQAVHGASANGY